MNSAILNENNIRKVENQLLEAMKRSDVQVLDQLIHDDLLFVLPTGEVITKEMDLETHRSGNIVFEEIISSVETIKLIEDNAIVTLSLKLKGKMLQQGFEGRFRYIRVWKMMEEKFKIIAGSCTAI